MQVLCWQSTSRFCISLERIHLISNSGSGKIDQMVMRREKKKDDERDHDTYRHYTTTQQRANSRKPYPEEDTFNDYTGGKSIFVGSFEAGASVRGGGDSVVLEGDLALREG